MNNPINALRLLIGNAPNPKQVIEQMVKTNKNPMIDNLLNMARTGNSKGVEEFAKNVFKEQGRDFDKEFSEFMRNFK